jgi:pimeloyl-ACP methyl ester carboxylesterase
MSDDLTTTRPVAGSTAPAPASRGEAPLAPFQGASPPAPDWFKAAVADEPERSYVTSLGSRLELLTWGEIGRPGLLLVHGSGAHADWWSFIAPLLATEYRVAAFSLAGQGGSDWREHYSNPDFSEDAEACARAAGLYESGRKPTHIAHSFGGRGVMHTACFHPERLERAVLIDSGFGPPPPHFHEKRDRRHARRDKYPDASKRIYPTVAEALARFVLSPPQPSVQLYTIDFVARHALKQAPLPDGSGEGWTWRFDQDFWDKFALVEGGRMFPEGERVRVPLAYIYGENSTVLETGPLTSDEMPPDTPKIPIVDAHHHVLLDQPLALVAALRTLLKVWPA